MKAVLKIPVADEKADLLVGFPESGLWSRE